MTVYDILRSSNACEYYRLEEHPGSRSARAEVGNRYAYLDNGEILRDLLEFSDGGFSKAKLFIPAIHCSSCIWLLENLSRLNPGIVHSSVHFINKELTVTWRDQDTTFRQLVELLVSVNYVPHIALDKVEKSASGKLQRGLLYRLGVAGFCFGNIMLFSFPAYLSVDDAIEEVLRNNFGLMNILLGTAVAFFSGSGYLVSAWKGLRKGFVSIDVPIALGILVLYCRSVYEILSGTGPGFMDSLAGLVFFLLVGKWYQGKTYQALSFERDYRSYFPVAVTILTDSGGEEIIPLKNLKTGMRILVRNQELIPADAILVKGNGAIDYSFVTGESAPVERHEGQRIFAGGRQTGTAIELIVEKEVTQSRLTELWNQDHLGEGKKQRWDSLLDVVGKYFTVAILLLAALSGIFWWSRDPATAVQVVTAVLIVACPCALALTLPFAFGGTMRVFGRNGFYLKRTQVVEALAKADTIVFDKTGTITLNDELDADLSDLDADPLTLNEIRSLVRHSTHPFSVAAYRVLPGKDLSEVSEFSEVASKGIAGRVNGRYYRIGSGSFAGVPGSLTRNAPGVHVSRDNRYLGFIRIGNRYRDGMEQVMTSLSSRYELHLLSGDQDSERNHLLRYFPSGNHLHFNQAPEDKLQYVRKLQSEGRRVLMVGDGLNDAGALRESDCGISIADDIYHFSPACDAILESRKFHRLSDILAFSRISRRIVLFSILLSLIYNVAGLSFAVAGKLTPILSAILMPLSSVSIVAFISLAVMITARRMKMQVGI